MKKNINLIFVLLFVSCTSNFSTNNTKSENDIYFYSINVVDSMISSKIEKIGINFFAKSELLQIFGDNDFVQFLRINIDNIIKNFEQELPGLELFLKSFKMDNWVCNCGGSLVNSGEKDIYVKKSVLKSKNSRNIEMENIYCSKSKCRKFFESEKNEFEAIPLYLFFISTKNREAFYENFLLSFIIDFAEEEEFRSQDKIIKNKKFYNRFLLYILFEKWRLNVNMVKSKRFISDKVVKWIIENGEINDVLNLLSKNFTQFSKLSANIIINKGKELSLKNLMSEDTVFQASHLKIIDYGFDVIYIEALKKFLNKEKLTNFLNIFGSALCLAEENFVDKEKGLFIYNHEKKIQLSNFDEKREEIRWEVIMLLGLYVNDQNFESLLKIEKIFLEIDKLKLGDKYYEENPLIISQSEMSTKYKNLPFLLNMPQMLEHVYNKVCVRTNTIDEIYNIFALASLFNGIVPAMEFFKNCNDIEKIDEDVISKLEKLGKEGKLKRIFDEFDVSKFCSQVLIAHLSSNNTDVKARKSILPKSLPPIAIKDVPILNSVESSFAIQNENITNGKFYTTENTSKTAEFDDHRPDGFLLQEKSGFSEKSRSHSRDKASSLKNNYVVNASRKVESQENSLSSKSSKKPIFSSVSNLSQVGNPPITREVSSDKNKYHEAQGSKFSRTEKKKNVGEEHFLENTIKRDNPVENILEQFICKTPSKIENCNGYNLGNSFRAEEYSEIGNKEESSVASVHSNDENILNDFLQSDKIEDTKVGNGKGLNKLDLTILHHEPYNEGTRIEYPVMSVSAKSEISKFNEGGVASHYSIAKDGLGGSNREMEYRRVDYSQLQYKSEISVINGNNSNTRLKIDSGSPVASQIFDNYSGISVRRENVIREKYNEPPRSEFREYSVIEKKNDLSHYTGKRSGIRKQIGHDEPKIEFEERQNISQYVPLVYSQVKTNAGTIKKNITKGLLSSEMSSQSFPRKKTTISKREIDTELWQALNNQEKESLKMYLEESVLNNSKIQGINNIFTTSKSVKGDSELLKQANLFIRNLQ